MRFGPAQTTDRFLEQVYLYLTATFITGIVVTNLISAKLVKIGPFTFSAGVIAFSITFPITDVIG